MRTTGQTYRSEHCWVQSATTAVRPPSDGKLVRWPVWIRWYAVTRRRGLRVWVSWGSQRVVANWLAIRCGGGSRGFWTVKVIGELIEGIAGRAGLENVRDVGERLTKSDRGPFGGRAGEVAEKLLEAVGSDLLDFGQLVITGLKSTTGQGNPDSELVAAFRDFMPDARRILFTRVNADERVEDTIETLLKKRRQWENIDDDHIETVVAAVRQGFYLGVAFGLCLSPADVLRGAR